MASFLDSLPSSAGGVSRPGGRGRGRIVRRPDLTMVPGRIPTTVARVTEDAVDACIGRVAASADDRFEPKPESKIAQDFAGLSLNDNGGEMKTDLRASSVSSSTEQSISENLAEGESVRFVTTSVNFEEKFAWIKLPEKSNKEIKAVVHIAEKPILNQWMTENDYVFGIEMVVTNGILSALDLCLGKELLACRMEKSHGELFKLFVDLTECPKFKDDLMSSIMYTMIPRLPSSADAKKIAVITNIMDTGAVTVVLNDSIWHNLRKAILKIQVNENLVSPSCPVVQDLYKELIEAFQIKHFLAPFQEDWKELYRVKVLGFCNESVVQVKYLDLGKYDSVRIQCLTFPTQSDNVPQLIDMIPPLAVTLRVNKLNPDFVASNKQLTKHLEGRPCYIQILEEESSQQSAPCANLLLANISGPGTLSVADVYRTNAMGVGPVAILDNGFNPEPLRVVQKMLEEQATEREKNLKPLLEKAEKVGRSCVCCSSQTLCKITTETGSFTIPGVGMMNRLERMIEGIGE